MDATSISVTSYKKMVIGDSEKLSYSIYPSNSNNVVTWSSSDETIASVTQDGVVTAKKAGTTNVKVETDNGKYDICNVNVPPLPNKITLSESVEVNLNKMVQLTTAFIPYNALDYVLWSSSDNAIATIDEGGMITGHSVGQATITARCKNATDVSATCVVTVRQPEYKLIVWTKDGSKVSYQLNKRPVLTYENGTIMLTTMDTSIEYKAEDIEKYTFENPDEGTNAVQQPLAPIAIAQIEQQGESILFEQCVPHSIVQIFSVNGTLIDTYVISADGTLLISVGQYPQGIYVIKTVNLTHKFIKR